MLGSKLPSIRAQRPYSCGVAAAVHRPIGADRGPENAARYRGKVSYLFFVWDSRDRVAVLTRVCDRAWVVLSSTDGVANTVLAAIAMSIAIYESQ